VKTDTLNNYLNHINTILSARDTFRAETHNTNNPAELSAAYKKFNTAAVTANYREAAANSKKIIRGW